MKPVLICGGVGKKMWPISRTALPKHFLPLFNGKSLFQMSFESLLLGFKPEEIFIQTTKDQAELAFKQCPELVHENCLVEPERKDHGPAMGFMALKLSLLDPKEPFILVQVDVIRDPVEKFLQTITVCDNLIKKYGKLVTGGIRPQYPVMGVDYLKVNNLIEDIIEAKVFQMDSWLGRDTEEEKIKEYLNQEKIFLHANHYAWTPESLLEAYRVFAPDWYQSLMLIKEAFGKPKEEELVKDEYAKMPRGPAERVTTNVLKDGFVVELPFRWLDFGTFASLQRYEESEGKNVKDENILEIDSHGNYIKKPAKKFAAIIGLNDIVVIDTIDGLLVCHKDKTGKVGEVAKYLKEKGKTEYL